MKLPVTLLLVEDEPLIRLALAEDLAEAGFHITSACHGQAALKKLEEDAMRYRAILTDIRLGDGPDGWSIARRARELVPGMPIIYMSGDSASDWVAQGVPGSVMVPKPFVSAQIVTAVSHLLNHAERG